MGKRKLKGRQHQVPASDKPFHLTVGVAPTADPSGTSLATELKLLKAAILYGDQITLCSPAVFMTQRLLSGVIPRPSQIASFFERNVIGTLSNSPTTQATFQDAVNFIRRIEQEAQPDMADLRKKRGLEKMLAEEWRQLVERQRTAANKAGYWEIQRALRTGLVTVHDFGTMTMEAISQEFAITVEQIVSRGSSYPLLDDGIGNLVRLGIEQGVLNISEARVARGKQVGLAGALLRELPLFDEAPMDEILDIRRELAKPLVNFRAAMIDFSSDLKSATWDEDFPLEAEDVYYQKVAPAMLEIEEAIKANSGLAAFVQFARQWINMPEATATGIGATLGFAIAPLISLPVMVTASLAAGAFGGAVTTYDFHQEREQTRAEIEQNQLFFYYRARERLRE